MVRRIRQNNFAEKATLSFIIGSNRVEGKIMNRKTLVVSLFALILLNANGYSQTTAPIAVTPPILKNYDFDAPDFYVVGDITGDIGDTKAVYLAKPVFPNEAKAAGAEGKVKVEIEIDEEGGTTSARAVSGHPSFYDEAQKAALKSKFLTPKISGQREKAAGYLSYHFIVEKPNWFTVGYDVALTGKSPILDFLQTAVVRKAFQNDWAAENEMLAKLDEIKRAGPRKMNPLFVSRVVQNSGGISTTIQRDEIKLNFARQNPEQVSLSQNLISELSGRLGNDQKSLWQFNLGVSFIEFNETFRNPKMRRESSEILRRFVQSAPADIQPEYLNRLKNLIDLYGQKYTDQEEVEISRAIADLHKIK